MRKQSRTSRIRDKATERLDTVITTKGDAEWTNMMNYFKNNPSALMDAFPTPPGSDNGEETPKKKDFDLSMSKPVKRRDDDNISIRSGASNYS